MIVNAPVPTVSPVAAPAVTLAPSPMNACVSFVTIGIAAEAPTAAEPATERLPPITFIPSDSVAETRTLPPAATTAPPAMYASVVTEKTGTPTLTFTAAVPAKPPPTAIDASDSLDVASTVALPVSVALSVPASQASVSLVTTSTSTPAPTPAVPPMASAPATLTIAVVSVAETARPALAPVPEMTTLSSTCAIVLSFITSTTTEPATPTESPPAPPTAMYVPFSLCVAETLTPAGPADETCAPWWMAASTVPLRTSTTPLEAPTPALPPPMATLPEESVRSAVSEALTLTLPPALTTASSSM